MPILKLVLWDVNPACHVGSDANYKHERGAQPERPVKVWIAASHIQERLLCERPARRFQPQNNVRGVHIKILQKYTEPSRKDGHTSGGTAPSCSTRLTARHRTGLQQGRLHQELARIQEFQIFPGKAVLLLLVGPYERRLVPQLRRATIAPHQNIHNE